MALTLPDLPYAFDALEPHIDAKTMEIHHDKHHAAYVANANKALEGSDFAQMEATEILRKLADVPESIRGALRNNVGGHVNHSLFWRAMAAPGGGGGGNPTGELASAIDAAFGSFDAFKEQFETAAKTRFGSGWAWLCRSGDGVSVCSTPNQDNPIMGEAFGLCGGTPILGLDVWEHAYYLHYQNRRPDYVSAFWNVVNWDAVAQNFANA